MSRTQMNPGVLDEEYAVLCDAPGAQRPRSSRGSNTALTVMLCVLSLTCGLLLAARQLSELTSSTPVNAPVEPDGDQMMMMTEADRLRAALMALADDTDPVIPRELVIEYLTLQQERRLVHKQRRQLLQTVSRPSNPSPSPSPSPTGNTTAGGDILIGPPRPYVMQPYYEDDYECLDPTYNCDYYDYGVNIEGTGSMGVLVNVLLDQINALANLTPRLGARARADSAVIGSSPGTQSASRRNTTVVLQNRPSRTAGLYTTGGVGVDPRNITAFSAGTSTAVAKNIVSVGFPVNNYGSSGESFVITNSSGTVGAGNSSRAAAARSLSGGLATAGNRAVATTTGTFSVGPVIGIFNAGNRAGAASQNGVFSQTSGTTGFSYLQSTSLGVVSPGNPRLMENMKKNKTDDGNKDGYDYPSGPDISGDGGGDGKQGPGSGAGGFRNGGGDPNNQNGEDYSNKVPLQDYYYYDTAEGGKPEATNAAGGVSKAWVLHRDLVNAPSRRQFNDRTQLNTFGAANGFGWTRGVSQNEVLATGTRNAGARLRGGAFGTGATALTASVASVTDLLAVQCKKGRTDGKGNIGDTDNDCVPLPNDNKKDDTSTKPEDDKTTTRSAIPQDTDAPRDEHDGPLLSAEQAALLGNNMFDVRPAKGHKTQVRS